MAKIISYTIFILLFVTGCSTDETEYFPEDNVLVEVKAPQTDGWSTKDYINTRNYSEKTTVRKEEDGLNIKIHTLPDTKGTAKSGINTRWANMEDNITFRVIAYKCADAANISTANYAGYGDYRLSGSSVQTNKKLSLLIGTYTFVCYSFGNSNSLAGFDNSTTNVPVSNGQNFMICIKPNISINKAEDSKYTLDNIVFKHLCARYRVLAKAQSGRMSNITACSGSITLPKKTAVYSFTDNTLNVQEENTETVNILWNNPDAMEVYSEYIYLLPQNSAKITVSLDFTVGGKAYTNKSITADGLTFTANNTYYSSIDFSTDQGYIVGGVIWANGNLYYENKEYKFFPNTEDFIGGTNTGEIFYYNALLPYPSLKTDPVKTWNPANDPCSKIAPANTWRTPSSKDFTKLQEAGYTIDAVSGSKKGFKFGNTLFLPYCGYLQSKVSPYYKDKDYRGLYATSDYKYIFVFWNSAYANGKAGCNMPNDYNCPWDAFCIRCIRD